jgi:4-hydroxybenzoate decarboxylase
MSGLSSAAREVADRVHSLRDFLALLEEHDQLVAWPDTVTPEPDIRRVCVAAGRISATAPAIMFERILGYPGKRIVSGVHGSFANLALLLGLSKGSSVKQLFFALRERWGCDQPLITRINPGLAPVHQHRIEKDINLYELLPLYRINEYDGGFYIAKASVASRDPMAPNDFSKQNVGIYRIQIHGPDLFSLDAVPSHDMGTHIRAAEQNNKPLKIAAMIGNHPAMPMFAATPVNYDESEYAYVSQMMGTPLELTEAGNGVDILAQSELVIEAELINNERILEGPFGEFPGTYSGVRRLNLFRVTAVSHQSNPIFESIYIGARSWCEHDTLTALSTCLPIYAQLKQSFPEVVAVNALYQHGLTAIIAVSNRFAGFAKSVAMRALGTPHGLMYLKNVILVDGDIDPFDLNQVMWCLSTRTRATDIVVLPNMALSDADPSAEIPGKGHRLVIDATSFMAPDPIGGDSKLVTPPTGEEIDELAKTIAILQRECSRQSSR